MAKRLLDAGHDLTVWNRTRAKAEPLAEAGATIVDRISDLAHADLVFVMVSTPADLEEVVIGADGLLSGTHRPADHRRLLERGRGHLSPRTRSGERPRRRVPGGAGQRQPPRGRRR